MISNKKKETKQTGTIHLAAIGILAVAAAGTLASNYFQTSTIAPSRIRAGVFAEQGNYIFPGTSRIGIGIQDPQSVLDVNGILTITGPLNTTSNELTLDSALNISKSITMANDQYFINQGSQRGQPREDIITG